MDTQIKGCEYIRSNKQYQNFVKKISVLIPTDDDELKTLVISDFNLPVPSVIIGNLTTLTRLVLLFSE